MAGSAEVGALRVMLGMDAADFEQGIRSANALLGNMTGRFAAASTAGVVAGTAIVGAFRAVMRQLAGFGEAINRAGEFADMSEKFGVSAETLMTFGRAAEQAGGSAEGFAKGLQKLSVGMADLASGQSGKSADALKALGISATTASGGLRGTDAVMLQLADKFAAMKDNAAQTALAVAIFGKSGAELIPLLNQGSKELARQADEARNLGLVLDSETAKGLEQLGDKWANVTSGMRGFWTQLSGELLPTMDFLLTKIRDWMSTEGGVKSWAKSAADGIKGVLEFAFQAGAAFSRLAENVRTAGAAFGNFLSGQWSKIAEGNEAGMQRLVEIEKKLNEDLAGIRGERYAREIEDETKRADAIAVIRANATHQLTEGEKELNRLLEESKRLTEEMFTPNEALAHQMEKLDILMQHTGLSAATYGRAMEQAAWGAANAHAAAGSKIMSNLSQVFGKAKGFAIAQAVINTFEAFTAALKGPPGPPWSYAIAASTLAAGFAQVQNIKNTNPGSASGGSSSASSSSAAGGAAAPVQQQGMYVNLEGQSFGREQVVGLIDMINQAGRDGYKIEVSR